MGVVEIITAIVSVTAVGTPISWLWARQNKMNAILQETYSKAETKEQIELRQKPMQDALDRNTEVCNELAKVLTELRLELAREKGNGKEG